MAPALSSLWFCPYQIVSSARLNSKEGFERKGWLLRCEFTGSLVGYADFHPLAATPPYSLERAFEDDLRGRASPQFKNSLEWAWLDAQARHENRLLVDPKSLPNSHFLIQDLTNFDFKSLVSLWEKGFRHLKIKLGRDFQNETEALNALKSELGGFTFKLRLDFNSSNSVSTWQEWESWLVGHLATQIEYIEDPLPWERDIWRASRLPLALDFERSESLAQAQEWVNTVIWKPALGETFSVRPSADIIVTHLMDHPLGQMGAIYWAQSHEIAGVGGYLNGDLRDSLEFYQDLKTEGPQAKISRGTGWGFDERLKALAWQKF